MRNAQRRALEPFHGMGTVVGFFGKALAQGLQPGQRVTGGDGGQRRVVAPAAGKHPIQGERTGAWLWGGRVGPAGLAIGVDEALHELHRLRLTVAGAK